MPRPGPRPYECVRRAWHSDRHQPIRGSIIQEIFRLTNEIHGAATRKNKEWQEKLPFVVLKAEEIMYSKANSEAEYMDLTTLWDRVNDAIDTIIRKDDVNQRTDLLQPCIEAALNLGCVPRRASRSQRHSNPVCYLRPKLKEAVDVSLNPKGAARAVQVGSTSMLQPSNLHGRFKSSSSALEAEVQFIKPSPDLSFQVRGSSMPLDSCFWSNLGRVYPLYYGECRQSKKSDSQEPMGNNVCDPPKPSLQAYAAADVDFSPDLLGDCHAEASGRKPDLSLRLGLPSPPSSDVGSSSSCDGGEPGDESCSSKCM